MALRWRKGENPALDAKVEDALHKDNVKRAARGQVAGLTPADVDRAIAEANARAGGQGRRGRRWSAAKPTDGSDGIRYASKMEARVSDRLRAALGPEERLVCQPSFPLLVLEPGRDGKVARFTPDFAILTSRKPIYLRGWTWLGSDQWLMHSQDTSWHQQRGLWIRFVEAKGARRSRDYTLRRDAFAATYGPIFEWDGMGDLPWIRSSECSTIPQEKE